MSRDDQSIVEVQFARHRWVMRQAERKMEYWGRIADSSEFGEISYAKGRHLAAKEFFEWLANGGRLEDAKAWLEGRKQQRNAEYERFEAYSFMDELTEHVRSGHLSEEEARRWKVYTPGFKTTDEERAQLKGISVMNKAGEVEFWHLERLLKDPFVRGEVNEPLPPPPRAVVDPDDEGD